MVFIPLYIDCAERTGGAQVLACSATDATFRIDNGYLMSFAVCSMAVPVSMPMAFAFHHLYGTCRTMTGTIPAFHIIGQYHTVLSHPYGMTDLYRRFLCSGDRMYRTRRTYIGTLRTFRTAITAFIRGLRLHQHIPLGRWA